MEFSSDQIGVGGAVLIGILAVILKFKPRSTVIKSDESGQRPTEYWQMEISKIVDESIRRAMQSRNEEIRRILREELRLLIVEINSSK